MGATRPHLKINVDTSRASGVRAQKVSRARSTQVHAGMLGAQQFHPSGDLLGAAMPNVRYKKNDEFFSHVQKRAKREKRENKKRETIHQTQSLCDLLLPRVERFLQPPAACECAL